MALVSKVKLASWKISELIRTRWLFYDWLTLLPRQRPVIPMFRFKVYGSIDETLPKLVKRWGYDTSGVFFIKSL